jgi:hypothetical protein
MTDTLSSPFQIASNDNGGRPIRRQTGDADVQINDMELYTKALPEFSSGINNTTKWK